MVITSMGTAYNWTVNTQTGRDLFANQKLVASHNYVNSVRGSHPALRDLTGKEHEMNALVLYGPYASATQHYYEPNSNFSDWVINNSGNQNGVSYANEVVALMK